VKKLAALCLLLVLTAACGDDGDGRPSADDLAKALGDQDNAVATQFTEAFSDALQAIVDGDDDFKGSDKDSAALQDATTSMAKCIAG
jgi:hypothetical protein